MYTVKWGDFLLGIATSYKVTLADLLAVNNLTVTSLITPGSQISLPAYAVAPRADVPAASPTLATSTSSPTGSPAAPAVAGLTYTIKNGDFLGGIASKYKITLNDLLAVNKLKANSLIVPGAKLALPAGAVEPPTTPALVETTLGPAGVVVAYAYAQLGKPYRFFTEGPNSFDCSGLVKAAYAQIGITLIHHRRVTGHLRRSRRFLERADQGR